MALVHNPSWIGFDGTPVTGRVPASVVMMAGDMTPALQAEVQHVYLMFCLAKNVAVVDYFMTDRHLADGSRVRITSMQDRDTVQVWTRKAPQPALGLDGAFIFDWEFFEGWYPEPEGLKHMLWPGYAKANLPADPSGFKPRSHKGARTWSAPSVHVSQVPVQVHWGHGVMTPDFLVGGHSKIAATAVPNSTPLRTNPVIEAACLVKTIRGWLIRALVLRNGETLQSQFVDFGPLGKQGAPWPTLRAVLSDGYIEEVGVQDVPAGRTGWTRPVWPGEWAMKGAYERYGMPSFNASGTRLAFHARVRGDVAHSDQDGSWVDNQQGGAIAEIEVGASVLTVHKVMTTTQSNTGTSNATLVPGRDGLTIGTSTASNTLDAYTLLDVGYLGNQLVWAWKRKEITSSASTNQGLGGNSDSRTTHWRISAGHSLHGELVSFEHSMGWSTSITYGSPVATFTGQFTGNPRDLNISYGGDLQNDCFCFGWNNEDFCELPGSRSYSGSAVDDGMGLAGVSLVVSPSKYLYDIFLGGARVDTGVPGPRCWGENDLYGVNAPTPARVSVSAGVVTLSNVGAISSAFDFNLPAGSYTTSHSATTDIDPGDRHYGSTDRQWAFASGVSGIEAPLFVHPNAWVTARPGHFVECVAAPDRRAAFFAERERTLGDAPEGPGLRSFYRRKFGKESVEVFRMVFSAGADHPRGPFESAPIRGRFMYPQIDTPTTTP